jgi:DNA-binding CsgD family transcriptional regulator
MIRNEEHLASVAGLLSGAGLGGGWMEALDAFAEACGAESGQLLGIGSDFALPFNWMTRSDPAAVEEFREIGGGNPLINPRVRVGLRQGILEHWHGADCATEAELRRNFVYADYARRYGLQHGSQTAVVREGGTLIGLAVLRGEKLGLPDEADQRAFETLAVHVRSAVLTQLAVEGQGAVILADALEGLSLAAFVCDAMGRVRALTPAAEACVRTGPLRLREGRLAAADPAESRALADAVQSACLGFAPLSRPAIHTVMVRGRDAASVTVVDVIALPARPHAFGFQPRVVVAVRGGGRAEPDLRNLLARAFGLTGAEADVAVRLAEGDPREAIATARGASLETVHSQVKSLYAKLDVRRLGELHARLAQLRFWR